MRTSATFNSLDKHVNCPPSAMLLGWMLVRESKTTFCWYKLDENEASDYLIDEEIFRQDFYRTN